jgi:hypothetical protein
MKEAILKCGCCGGCIGACFPIDRDADPDELIDIPWLITAPACPAIDGMSGVFTPLNPADKFDWPQGSCGPCTCYFAITELVLPGKFYLAAGGGPFPDPPPFCMEDTCNIRMLLYLTHDLTVQDCCNITVVVQFFGVENGLELNSGELLKENTLDCIPQSTPPDHARWRQYLLDACECLPDEGGFAGEFDLSRIGWFCVNGVFPSGACAGLPQCCVLDGCSLAGAVLSI